MTTTTLRAKLRQLFPAEEFEGIGDSDCEHPRERRVINGFNEICGRCALTRGIGQEPDGSES